MLFPKQVSNMNNLYIRGHGAETRCLYVSLTQVYSQFAQLLPSAHVTDYYLLHPASLQTKQTEKVFILNIRDFNNFLRNINISKFKFNQSV